MPTIEQLVQAVCREAARAEFPIDRPAYEKAGKNPLEPVLFAGSLDAHVAVLGRDLGKDEVAAGQPLIGAGGRLVRSGFYRAETGEMPPTTDRKLESVLSRVLLTNTVPYKPPGNKAYTASVKERFRPFLAELLIEHWRGKTVITLGTEAFQWFTPYLGDAERFWSREDRYEAEVTCEMFAKATAPTGRKTVTLLPLPHPSPLNQRWYAKFPDLLARRLAKISGIEGRAFGRWPSDPADFRREKSAAPGDATSGQDEYLRGCP